MKAFATKVANILREKCEDVAKAITDVYVPSRGSFVVPSTQLILWIPPCVFTMMLQHWYKFDAQMELSCRNDSGNRSGKPNGAVWCFSFPAQTCYKGFVCGYVVEALETPKSEKLPVKQLQVLCGPFRLCASECRPVSVGPVHDWARCCWFSWRLPPSMHCCLHHAAQGAAEGVANGI